jgi:glyoxylase I family protein
VTVSINLLFAVALCAAAMTVQNLAAPGPQQPDAAKKRVHGPGLHHIAIKVADFDKSVKLYADCLGMKQVFKWGEGDGRGCFMDMGDGNYIELFAGGKLRASPPDSPILHVALRNGDPDAAYKKALDAGAKSQMAPTDVTIPGDRPLKIRIAFVVGLDGEVIEFFKNEDT